MSMLKVVSREQTLAIRAHQQLEQLIVERTYQPGDRLPSEAEMGQMLGVSRTVVREAVRLLSAKGLVEARAGSGIYVTGPGFGMMEEPMSLLIRSQYVTAENLIEVRETMEVRIAGLAAERATAEEIEKIDEAVRVLQKPRLTVNEFVEADLGFHNLLASATGNPLFTVLSHSMNEVMAKLHAGAYRLDSAVCVQSALQCHTKILLAVKGRNPIAARQAMEEHLVDSREWTRRVAESAKGRLDAAQAAKVLSSVDPEAP